MRLELRVNARQAKVDVEPGTPLLDALRGLGLFSVKRGCETGECGVCAVLVDGVPRNTCIMPAAQAEGRSLTTVESLGQRGSLHVLQEAFLAAGAVQCGFCTPAMLVCAKALLDRHPLPSEQEARAALGSVLCRCTGYVKPVQALLEAAEKMATGPARVGRSAKGRAGANRREIAKGRESANRERERTEGAKGREGRAR